MSLLIGLENRFRKRSGVAGRGDAPFRQSSRFWGPLVSSIIAGALLAGCGGSSPSTDRASLTPSPTPTPTPTPTPVPAPTVILSADQTTILRGQSAVLSWSSSNATALVSSNFGASTLNGTATLSPATATTYTLTVRNDSGQTSIASIAVEVTPVTVSISPSPAAVDISRTLTFTAQVTGAVDTGVTWSVQEPTGGSITPAGVYTAPAIAGVYHIQAVSAADTSKVAVVEVRVRAAGGSINVN